MARSPKRRGYSTGRIKGYKTTPRTRHQVIKGREQKFSKITKSWHPCRR
nr:hypothetical protein [Okeania sp. SIO2F4]